MKELDNLDILPRSYIRIVHKGNMGQWHTKGQCDGAKGPTLCLNDKAFVYFWLTVQIPSNTFSVQY